MNPDKRRRVIQVFITLMVQLLILFLAAGNLKWVWIYVFICCSLVILVINFIVIPDEVIKERGRKKKNVKIWDKVINGLNIIPSLGIYVVSGLDHRFGWTESFPIWIHLSGLLLFFSSSMLFTWSMVSNSFFSTMVRIQDERNHTVATSGPYKYIRHPGYVGFIVMILSTPLLFGSLYALICSIISMILIIIRTSLEDKTLNEELAGYNEYAKQVKYKLIPFIW
ncbi:MAG: isoprenylcysteine carboxylmethyltransferase family protein [Clostridiales bacterium]|nr:isoprenylcysteine carboxylmethyltransferase family protein [Clostridiales bacterium]